ncbi:MAG: type II secretion system minor pseudopilin GspK [Pseudomonadota bacterium]
MRRARRQRGVAVITALLLTSLAITIVASLFWQQQVQVRSMENQRLHLQTKWILRGALDLSRLILRQDGLDPKGKTMTVLTSVWATPLEETRLDDYIERERQETEKFDATLSGQINDAQARYNLTSLAVNKAPAMAEVEVLKRLLNNLQLNPALALPLALEVAKGQVASSGTPVTAGQGTGTGTETGTGTVTGTGTGTGTGTSTGTAAALAGTGGQTGPEPMEFLQVDDVLAVAGFTPQAVERLREFVVVLPQATLVNVNTAAPEVLASVVDFSVSEANALVVSRKQNPFISEDDFRNKLAGKQLLNQVKIAVNSAYFLASSRVRLDRATLEAEALIYRNPQLQMQTTVLAIREY